MDTRYDRLKAQDSPVMSRSFPGPGNIRFQDIRAVGSEESLLSTDGVPQKSSKYSRLIDTKECDMCHNTDMTLKTLKCMHSICVCCYGFRRTNCPLCERSGLQQQLKYACGTCCNTSSHMCTKCQTRFCVVCLATDLDTGSTSFCNHDIKVISQVETNAVNGDEFRPYVNVDFDMDEEVPDFKEGKARTILELIDLLGNVIVTDLTCKIEQIHNIKADIKCDVLHETEKIRAHVQKLKAMIDQKAEIMIKSLYESKARHKREYDRQESQLTEKLETIKSTVNFSKEYLRTIKSAERNNNAEHETASIQRSLEELIKTADQMATEQVHIRFTCKPTTDAMVESITGRSGVRVFLADLLQFHRKTTLELDGGVTTICPVNSEMAWVGYQRSIQLISKSGDVDDPIKLDQDVHDLAIDSLGNLIIACQKSVECRDKNGFIRRMFDCLQAPHGIACLEDGNIILSLSGNTSLSVVNRSGRVVKHIDCGRADMKMPYKLAVNNDGDICVTDYKAAHGDVVIFDVDGHIKGCVRTDGMAPRGLACDQQGRMYAADFRSDRVNVYSVHGHFLQIAVDAEENGLSGPLSVAIDRSGDLWVGDWKGKVRVYQQTV